MIDIHTHLLFDVDDGAKSLQESLAMIEDEKEQGVDAIILTPHYRHGMFPYQKEKIEENYRILKEESASLGVQLYLGTEQHVDSMTVKTLKTGRCHTLADTQYVLAEYRFETDFKFIKASIQDMISHGYIPIVAHVERYKCMDDLKNIELLREIGAMIQVNADAVIGKDGMRAKSYTKKLLKNGYVDFVASDCHGIKERSSNMGKCSEYLHKKYDYRYVDRILEENAKKILEAKG